MGVWTSGTNIFLSLWETYVSPRSPGWMAFTQHVGVCCFVAFVSVGLLSGAFCWFLSSLIVFITSWMVTCVLLCCSKHARCFLLLFFLSCGLREGRNALIAAGTGVVIFGHVENIFHNFKGLLDSMTCNLRAKSFSIHFPLLKKYIEAIRWLYGLVTHLSLFDDLVSWNQTLEVSLFSPSQALEAQLNDTTDRALGVLYQMVTATEVLCSLGRQVLALTGLLLMLLGTGLFMKRFLAPCGWKFENIYLTRQFVQLDERERCEQRPCVLPLNKQERKKYVLVPSFWLTPKDRRNLGLFFFPVLTHLYIWLLFAAIDYLLYWLIFSMSKHFQSLPGLEVHLKLHRQEQGIQDIIHDSSFNISLFEPTCIPKPKLLLSKTWIPLSIILVILVTLGLSSSVLMQLKILVSASFYPSVQRERMQYLHTKILKKRSKQPVGEVKGKLSLYFTKIHFWLPVLEVIGKKQMDIASEDNPEETPHSSSSTLCQQVFSRLLTTARSHPQQERTAQQGPSVA